MARKRRNTRQIIKKASNNTVATEESSVYDSILSMCCCDDSFDVVENSLEGNDNNRDAPRPSDDHDKEPPPRNFRERVSDVALFLVGSAPPVKFVRCFECSSVDGSELTMPPVLNVLAEEHDRNNSNGGWMGTALQSLWNMSTDDDYPGTTHQEMFVTSQLDSSHGGRRKEKQFKRVKKTRSSPKSRRFRHGSTQCDSVRFEV